MKHYMQLNRDPFERIKAGLKNMEVRLNDEKRQKLSIGDRIIFNLRDSDESIETEILDLLVRKNFKEITDADMSKYYSKEDEEKYGIVGIKIKLIQT